MGIRRTQIGEVAERTGLSLRTIRYYEELGLVEPSARTTGGFRLYSETDVSRLKLIKRMKPLDFSLEEMREVLGILDSFDAAEGAEGKEQAVERLGMYSDAALARVEALQQQLVIASEFASDLRREISRQKKLVSRSR